MKINTVIETLENYPFDDYREGRSYINDLIKEYAENPITADEEIKGMIKDELLVFRTKISERQNKEFYLLPELFDRKYNHWHIIQWIFARHFVGVPKEFIPEYYFDLTAICNEENPGRTCISVVDKLLHKLE